MYTNELELSNKLYCTFSKLEQLDDSLDLIKKSYNILYNKIFILESRDSDEFILTYNVDPFNTNGELLPNTILSHRKKDFNVLYTINALNQLIKKLNNGILNTNFPINWSEYSNSILLTQNNEFKKLDTKVHKIISL